MTYRRRRHISAGNVIVAGVACLILAVVVALLVYAPEWYRNLEELMDRISR